MDMLDYEAVKKKIAADKLRGIRDARSRYKAAASRRSRKPRSPEEMEALIRYCLNRPMNRIEDRGTTFEGHRELFWIG